MHSYITVKFGIRALARRLAPAALLIAVACTGLSLGDNSAGEDTFMELGAIAVDHVTDTSFVLRTAKSPETNNTIKTLWAVPAKGAAKPIATLDGQGDVRVLFPAGGVMLMAEEDGKEFLTLLDRNTFSVKTSAVHDARYHGTRMSPSRRWVAVADTKKSSGAVPIRLIDTQDLSVHTVPGTADWLEAMWANGDDTLLVMASWRDNKGGSKWNANWDRTRVFAWKMSVVEQFNFQTANNGFWAHKLIDVTLPGYGADLFFSFSWVGVAPDDSHAVFPVLKMPSGDDTAPRYQLAVVNLLGDQNGTVRFVDNAKGPVGFTSDGSSIISYRDVFINGDAYNSDGKMNKVVRQDLLAIDLEKLQVEQLTVPFSGLINFFITGDGHFVVVAGWTGSQKLALFDLDADKGTTLASPDLDLHEVVPRMKAKELWICDDGLFRLRVEQGKLEKISLPFLAWHANLLPNADQIVVGNRDGSELVFLAPSNGKILRKFALPKPE